MANVLLKSNVLLKLCVKCDKVKTLEGGYYKAGSSWQKLCKLCHNERRCEYVHNGAKYEKMIKLKFYY